MPISIYNNPLFVTVALPLILFCSLCVHIILIKHSIPIKGDAKQFIILNTNSLKNNFISLVPDYQMNI
jgi:dihydrodipicolinate synthase/N-acetylneuraminate lyase